MAGELATAGHKVLVVEKGEYHHPEYYSKASEAESGRSLFERKGGLMTDDYTVFVMAGSTFGGGSTINWSASLRTPESVSTEWATKNKLSYFATDSFQADLDAVCKRLGVSTTAIKHNKPNQAMINGCKKFGVHVEDIPQNTASNSA